MNKSNQLSEKQFLFFTINYIVGFGFITTITSVIKTGYYGLIIFLLTALISLAVVLVFSRLGNEFQNEYGGSYLYAKKAFKKHFAFFQGWNQFIQGPILAAASPLFIADALNSVITNETAILVVRVISITFFITLVFISTLGIHLNKKVIFLTAIVKWLILFIGVGIAIYLASQNWAFQENFFNPQTMTPFLIFSNVLSFMYAFGGIEDVSAMAPDLKVKNFKKALLIAFSAILSFYFLVYIILNGLTQLNLINNFGDLYNLVFGTTGMIIFAIGLIFNGMSSKVSVSISQSRKIIPLANDGYLPKILSKQNKQNEYKYAILFGGIVTIISMIIFWLIPLLLHLENFFNAVIQLGTMAYLIQYALTIITAIYLAIKKKIQMIPWYEWIIYILALITIFTTLLIYVLPPIVNEPWTIQNTIIIVSYLTFIGLGYLLYGGVRLYEFKKTIKKL